MQATADAPFLPPLPVLSIRDARATDAAVLAELVEALNVSEGDPTGYVTAETMARDLAKGEIAALLATSGEVVLGYCLYHFGYESTYAASGHYIVDLYVAPESRERGIAKALIAEVARRAKAKGGCFVWWTSKPGNAIANATYAKLGAYSEPVIAHALFDDAFDKLAGATTATPSPPKDDHPA